MSYDCLIHQKLLDKELLRGPIIHLRLRGFYPGNPPLDLPNYCYMIMLGHEKIGSITLRLGFNEMTMIHGHIGYTIDPAYRGHGYSYYALQMILELAKAHGYERILVTCDPTNLRSIKSVLKSGGRMIIEHQEVPKDHIYYVLGMTNLHVYEISL